MLPPRGVVGGCIYFKYFLEMFGYRCVGVRPRTLSLYLLPNTFVTYYPGNVCAPAVFVTLNSYLMSIGVTLLVSVVLHLIYLILFVYGRIPVGFVPVLILILLFPFPCCVYLLIVFSILTVPELIIFLTSIQFPLSASHSISNGLIPPCWYPNW